MLIAGAFVEYTRYAKVFSKDGANLKMDVETLLPSRWPYLLLAMGNSSLASTGRPTSG
jgi:hypothetical protein